MKVLVCGGRDYDDYRRVCEVLDARAISFLVEGGASGADLLSRRWAQERGIPVKEYKADWKLHGRAAGPIRNGHMLAENPDIKMVFAFPGGRGTANMKQQALAKGIDVLEVRATRFPIDAAAEVGKS